MDNGKIVINLGDLPPAPPKQEKIVIRLEDIPEDTCPYCTQHIEPGEEVYTCPSCQVRSHKECWDAFKTSDARCAVYGCPGDKGSGSSRRHGHDGELEDFLNNPPACTRCGNLIFNNMPLVTCSHCQRPYHSECWRGKCVHCGHQEFHPNGSGGGCLLVIVVITLSLMLMSFV